MGEKLSEMNKVYVITNFAGETIEYPNCFVTIYSGGAVIFKDNGGKTHCIHLQNCLIREDSQLK